MSLEQIVIPLIISVIVYFTVIRVVVITSRRLTIVDSLCNSKISRVLFGIGLVPFLYLFIYIAPRYLRAVIAPTNYASSLIFLFTGFILVLPLWLYDSPPHWFLKCLSCHWRRLELPIIGKLDLEKLLHPIQSISSLLFWFILLIFMPYVIREWILFLLEGKVQVSPEIGTLIPLLIVLSLYVPLFEETFFRWVPFSLGGPRGLVLGTLFWFIWHPIQLIILGEMYIIIAITTITWAFGLPFYIKLWRGKYFWVSFIVHTVINCSVIIVHDLFGLPG